MKASHPIRVGGVPEHFNMPWHQAIEDGNFLSRGVEVSWTTCAGGTGQMTRALRAGELDLCVLLTEGIITDISRGNPSKIISQYVTTPLTWGVHTAVDNPLDDYRQIYDKRYAISRYGSGSHLMPIVDAHTHGHDLQEDQFVVIRDIDGALASLAAHESDVFYWEKFTTKPYVDSGQLRRVGEYVTPWPCFMIAATDQILEERPDDVIRVLRTIHDACDRFMQADDSIDVVSKRFHLAADDVAKWYHRTDWAIHGWVRDKIIESVLYHLRLAGIVSAEAAGQEYIWKR